MLDFNTLPCGDVYPAFAVPHGFAGVYPVCWRCALLEGAAALAENGLVYIISGRGIIAAPDGNTSYRAHQAIPFAKGCTVAAEEETRYLCLFLGGAEELLEKIGGHPVEDAGIGALLAQSYLKAGKGLPRDVFTASAECYALLMELHRHHHRERAARSGLARDAVGIMREEYPYLTGIDELAERLEVSKPHLIRCFSAEVGQGPGRYLQMVRLEQARLLLIGRDYGIDLIAGMVGYSCANYFCKVFRKAFGVSPGTYRKQYRRTSGPDFPGSRLSREAEVL